jgi:hypothetical protein
LDKATTGRESAAARDHQARLFPLALYMFLICVTDVGENDRCLDSLGAHQLYKIARAPASRADAGVDAMQHTPLFVRRRRPMELVGIGSNVGQHGGHDHG